MAINFREQVPLEYEEICLVKGMLANSRPLKLTQIGIAALFSYPDRTVSANVISAIHCGKVVSDDIVFPPADLSTCRLFLDKWKSRRDHNSILSTFIGPRIQKMQSSYVGYHYHAVGQGLFCSGKVAFPGRQPFRWVYDCGTEHGRRSPSRAALVSHQIAALANDVGAGHIDLVTLSHFDEDHLSGFDELLSKFSIGTLLLPYLTPWDRLILLIFYGSRISDDLLRFLISPVTFILERADGRIGQILLVPQSGDGPALPPLYSPEEPLPGGEPGEEIIKYADKDEMADQLDSVGTGRAGAMDPLIADASVKFIARGGWISFFGVWEFVPYNDAQFGSKATGSFKATASALVGRLTRANTQTGRRKALIALIALYDATFKGRRAKKISSRRRNEISLFLYSGPLGKVNLQCGRAEIPRRGMWPIRVECPPALFRASRFGQMFTGDGFLDEAHRYAAFERFYGLERLRRGGVLQVMHHGSRKNWHCGLAQKIDPAVSVFSSDPIGKNRHPHAEVVFDFERHYPVQVDGVHGWSFEGLFG